MASIRQALLGQPRYQPDQKIRFLVPVAGDDLDETLIKHVNKVAQKKYSDITMIYVVEVDQTLPLDADLPDEVSRGEYVLQHARRAVSTGLDLKTCHIETDLLQARLAGPAIVDEAVQQNVDVIIMGANVSKRLGKRTVGDTVDYVLKNAPCEVVILRAPMPGNLKSELEMDFE